MKRRSFFGALLGAASAPLVKPAPAQTVTPGSLSLTSGDYSGSVEVGDKFFGVARGESMGIRGINAWILSEKVKQ